MKLSTQTAVVISIGILGFCGLIFGLAVWAHWEGGVIVGFASGIGSVIVMIILQMRGQQKTVEHLEDQDVKLETIVAQTNGLSELERNDIAHRAASKVVQQMRGPGAEWRKGS